MKNIFFGVTLTVRALENKMYACMMLFFVCNAVESQLVSTGAFEISVDNMPVW
jgi:thioredoxin reductase-like selenoprotein T